MAGKMTQIASNLRWPETILALVVVCLLSLIMSGVNLTINYSRSIPRGLYYVQNRQAEQGEYTLVTSHRVLQYAQKRHYIIAGSLIGKRIIGGKGDRVCITDQGVFLNGKRVPHSKPLPVDSKGRPMPRIRGCMRLSGRQVFVMGNARKSFDSRYFGPIIHYKDTLIPLITFN